MPPTGFQFRHNWSSPFIERMTWRTGYRRSANAHEQRERQRQKPRVQYDMAVLTVNAATLGQMRAFFYQAHTKEVLAPFSPDKSHLLITAVSGTPTITIDTVGKNFDADSWVKLSSKFDPLLCEFAEILSLTDTTITLKTNLVNTWAGNATWVEPARRAHLNIEGQVVVRSETDTYENVAVSFDVLVEDQKVTPHRNTPFSPSLLYNGTEVFNIGTHNWTEPPDRQIQRMINPRDHGTGIFAVFSTEPAALLSWNQRLLLVDRTELSKFHGWHYAHAGKQKAFWLASGQPDFEWVSSSGNNLTVKSVNFSGTYGTGPLTTCRRDLKILLNDGTSVYRRITAAAAPSGGNDVLTLDNSAPTNVRMISFLHYARLNTDTIEISYDVAGSAETVFNVTDLLYPN